MVVNKWLNRTTEVVEAVVRHYTENVNTPAKFVLPRVLLESKYLPPANCSNKRFNLYHLESVCLNIDLKLA